MKAATWPPKRNGKLSLPHPNAMLTETYAGSAAPSGRGQFDRLDQTFGRNAESLMEFPDHRQSERALTVQDLVNPV